MIERILIFSNKQCVCVHYSFNQLLMQQNLLEVAASVILTPNCKHNVSSNTVMH